MTAYRGLMADKVRQEIHMPEYLVAVCRKVPKSAENTPLSSKRHYIHERTLRNFGRKTLPVEIEHHSIRHATYLST